MSDQSFAEVVVNKEFADHVLEGLSSKKKWLSSMYFYDEIGDGLFQDIMNLDEYYLTRAELDIMERHKGAILSYLIDDGGPCQVVELGAGDGVKTKILLKHFLAEGLDLKYLPIDISSNILEELELKFKQHLPDLEFTPLVGDYFKKLSLLRDDPSAQKLVLFMGANIGNYKKEDAIAFLSSIRENISTSDYLLLGIDLKKSPKRILSAYNDPQGVTRKFNMNLLERINNELDADFDQNTFIHSPTYDPVSGECKSYIMSTASQEVHVGALDRTFLFEEWEPMLMEISKKYNYADIEDLAASAGFKVVQYFRDINHDFADVLLQPA